MPEGTIQLPPDSTGKILRTQADPSVAGGAHQQTISVADSTGAFQENTDLTIRATGLAAVTATGSSADQINASRRTLLSVGEPCSSSGWLRCPEVCLPPWS